MRESHFLASAEVDRYLAFAPGPLKEIALELRNMVASVCPEATERILWGGLSYHNSRHGGPVKGAICQIELRRDHVRLSFIHGVRLMDRTSLLGGDRLSKRFLVLKSIEAAPWGEIRQLIEEAARLDPSTLTPLFHGKG
ncbi:MAG TPA: DUF1801 domain-containing protein [Anaerolineales bacterium]|nr:MAG: hypothetical protein A2Z37_15170 [Chloroflexi bacterium RBG_19FT_COMBO_62_14]HLE05214.1 DUF1801 domain-containing protein [Anaerolineales bacterium]